MSYLDNFDIPCDPNKMANQLIESDEPNYSDLSNANEDAFQRKTTVSSESTFQNTSCGPVENEAKAYSLQNANLDEQHVPDQPLSVINTACLWSNSSPSNTDGFAVKSNKDQPQSLEETISTSNSIVNDNIFKPQTANQFTQHNSLFEAFREESSLDVTQNDLSPDTTLDDLIHDAYVNINEENLWIYKDPYGLLHGEFTSAKMYGWHLVGLYFGPTLPLRRKCDDTFSTLADYTNLFGRIPFMTGPRIPPILGGITPMNILMVRTYLDKQQNAISENLNTQSLPDNNTQYEKLAQSLSKYVNWASKIPGKPINTDPNTQSISDSGFFQPIDQPCNLNEKNNSQTKSKSSRRKKAKRNAKTELNSYSSINCPLSEESKATNVSNEPSQGNEKCLEGICDKADAFLNEPASSADSNSVSHIGNSSSHSPPLALSTNSPQDKGKRLFVIHEDAKQTTELLTEKSEKNVKQSLNYGLVKSPETYFSSSLKTPKQETSCTDGGISQENSNYRQPHSFDKIIPLSKKANKSKKNSKSFVSLTNENSDELNSLISWVQSALTRIEFREKLDIPTFVEFLTTIDAPYEVESMLFAYLVKSKHSDLFVKEFLNRRHCCWKLYRKHVEKLTELQKDSTDTKTQFSEPTCVATDISVADNNENKLSWFENAESSWQEVKSKKNPNRKSKRTVVLKLYP